MVAGSIPVPDNACEHAAENQENKPFDVFLFPPGLSPGKKRTVIGLSQKETCQNLPDGSVYVPQTLLLSDVGFDNLIGRLSLSHIEFAEGESIYQFSRPFSGLCCCCCWGTRLVVSLHSVKASVAVATSRKIAKFVFRI